MAKRRPSSSQIGQTTTAKRLRPRSSEDGDAADCISALPDGVLQRILSLLPISAAARTSALSRRWRLLWTAIPSLNLHHHHADNILPKPSSSDSSYHRFVLAMLSALLRRSSADDVRSLRFLADHPHIADDAGSSPCCAADEIAAFALRKGAQELSLDFKVSSRNSVANRLISCRQSEVGGNYNPKFLHALPLSLLKLSPSLRVLRLKDCRIRVPSAAAAAGGLLAPHLETLWLTRVHPAEGDGRILPLLDRLIAGCPKLKNFGLEGYPDYWPRPVNGVGVRFVEALTLTCPQLTHLTLKCCHCFGDVQIDAPRLESLEFVGDVPLDFVLAGSPGLVRAEITFCNYENDNAAEGRDEFLQEFRSVQFLRVRAWHLEDILLPREIGYEALPIYHQLKHLELQGISPTSFVQDKSINGLVRLLEEMPILEHLTLGLNTKLLPFIWCETIQKFSWDKELEIPKLKGVSVNCLKYYLKTVKITDLQELDLHVALVKYLLRNALVLDEMYVRGSPAYYADHLRIHREILKLRVNPNTKVTMI